MLSINSQILRQVFVFFRRSFDLFWENAFYWIEIKNKQHKSKFHRYTRYTTLECSETFVLENIDKNLLTYSMASFGAGIKIGDFIVVVDKMNSATYQVVNIDYYLNPPDMWIAVLRKCSY
jgi:hypothetical protein